MKYSKSLAFVVCLVILSTFVNAAGLGFDNPQLPQLKAPTQASVTSTLFNATASNSSIYWGNYLWTDYAMPTIKLFGYNQTTPSNSYTDTQITSLDNSTIARAGNFNCTAGQVMVNITTNSSGVFGHCVAVSSGIDSPTLNSTYARLDSGNNYSSGAGLQNFSDNALTTTGDIGCKDLTATGIIKAEEIDLSAATAANVLNLPTSGEITVPGAQSPIVFKHKTGDRIMRFFNWDTLFTDSADGCFFQFGRYYATFTANNGALLKRFAFSVEDGDGDGVIITPKSAGNVEIPEALLDVRGDVLVKARISSGTATITASSDTTSVSGINTLFITCAGGNVVIGGFTGGIDGQILHVIRKCATGNDVTLEHVEGVSDQDIYLHVGADETLNGEYGGWILVCDGSDWYDCSHAKHV